MQRSRSRRHTWPRPHRWKRSTQLLLHRARSRLARRLWRSEATLGFPGAPTETLATTDSGVSAVFFISPAHAVPRSPADVDRAIHAAIFFQLVMTALPSPTAVRRGWQEQR